MHNGPQGSVLLPPSSGTDQKILAQMRALGGRWQTLVYPTPGGGLAFEYGASKFEHAALELLKAHIASGQLPVKENGSVDEQEMVVTAITRATLLFNQLGRMTVNVVPVGHPDVGKVELTKGDGVKVDQQGNFQ